MLWVCISTNSLGFTSMAKLLFSPHEPASQEWFATKFLTNADIYSELHEQLSKLNEYASSSQVTNWLSAECDQFGPLVTQHSQERAMALGRLGSSDKIKAGSYKVVLPQTDIRYYRFPKTLSETNAVSRRFATTPGEIG